VHRVEFWKGFGMRLIGGIEYIQSRSLGTFWGFSKFESEEISALKKKKKNWIEIFTIISLIRAFEFYRTV
jgi:hypothetical protein